MLCGWRIIGDVFDQRFKLWPKSVNHFFYAVIWITLFCCLIYRENNFSEPGFANFLCLKLR